MFAPVPDWLPPGKRAAVVFTIDDVHPGKAADHYDGGGDLGKGALGLVTELLERHPSLQVTLFTTADWREISPSPSKLFSRIPVIRDRMYLSRVLPPGTRRIDRHPEFLAYVRGMPRTEMGCHGLHHIHPGPLLHVEFQDEPVASHTKRLKKMLEIFDATGMPYVRGMCPPGWNATPALLTAMTDLGFAFVASARDLKTPISADARTDMSGIKGAPLIYPGRTERGLLHFATNFQATSRWERATDIIAQGGLLAVKGHIIKDALGYVAIDGIDAAYCNFLDLLFSRLEQEHGDALWWTTMGQIAKRLADQRVEKAS